MFTVPETWNWFKTIYLVFERMNSSIIKAKQKKTEKPTRDFTWSSIIDGNRITFKLIKRETTKKYISIMMTAASILCSHFHFLNSYSFKHSLPTKIQTIHSVLVSTIIPVSGCSVYSKNIILANFSLCRRGKQSSFT